MVNKIKHHIFYKEYSRIERHSKFMSWDDINSILLLFESDNDEENSYVKELIKMIKDEGKDVTACCYINKKQYNKEMPDSITAICNTDTDAWGRPKVTCAPELIKRRFDAVFDLTLNDDCLPLKYVLIRAKTLFRCGLHKDGCSLYDFEIELNNIEKDLKNGRCIIGCGSELELGKQIVRYLKQVKSI